MLASFLPKTVSKLILSNNGITPTGVASVGSIINANFYINELNLDSIYKYIIIIKLYR